MNWTTHDGRQIPISKLTNEHLLNIILFFRRRAEQERTLVTTYPPQFQGEIAQLSADQEYESWLQADVDDIITGKFMVCETRWYALLDEADKRGLTWILETN